MLELRTETEIDAPVERVWQVLTDFRSFPEWNPFIRRIQGRPIEGSRLEVVLGASGTRAMKFRPRVLKVIANRELRWLGRLGVPRLFDGEHIFELEALGPTRTKFVQRERFRGIFLPFLRRSLDRDARRGFEEMNQALRERAAAEARRTAKT
jgi:hypothetical protein